jgi:hypothetical protein
MLMDHSVPHCPCSHDAIRLHDRIVHVVEFIAEAGAVEKRYLRLEVCRIRSEVSRYRRGGVPWLDFVAPHSKHMVLDDTVILMRA